MRKTYLVLLGSSTAKRTGDDQHQKQELYLLHSNDAHLLAVQLRKDYCDERHYYIVSERRQVKKKEPVSKKEIGEMKPLCYW